MLIALLAIIFMTALALLANSVVSEGDGKLDFNSRVADEGDVTTVGSTASDSSGDKESTSMVIKVGLVAAWLIVTTVSTISRLIPCAFGSGGACSDGATDICSRA